MRDAILNHIPNVLCDDCGTQEVCITYWGPHVPPGRKAYLCGHCLTTRGARSKQGQDVLPLGQTDYSEWCAGKFVILLFPTVPNEQPPSVTPASLEELGEQINRELGFSLEYKASTPTLFEFIWSRDLVRERVNECLNKLRLEHPRLAITSREESCIA